MQWNKKLGIWQEDEWLVGLYPEEMSAKRAVERWGEGRQWDNPRELQITRYFRKQSAATGPAGESVRGDPAVCERVWLRYAEYTVNERSDDLYDGENERFYERGTYFGEYLAACEGGGYEGPYRVCAVNG